MVGVSLPQQESHVVVIGAGPGGLTAAYQLAKASREVSVVESDSQVGGISKTVIRNGWRFDLGGHRFFTKVARVEEFWHEILPDGDFLLRPRMSRIFYEGKFYDYPLKASNALKNLGLLEAIRCVSSYLFVRLSKPRDMESFEGWVSSRFGWRLYRIFFKTYTEKVWGMPASQIRADWAAQRIKNLSLGRAILNALFPRFKRKGVVTSLIEQFQYPRLGPGLMWEKCAEQMAALGGKLFLNTEAQKISRVSDDLIEVRCSGGVNLHANRVISTMPINRLIFSLDPPAPPEIRAAAETLRHRDFLTVALVVPAEFGFPDNWIYIHAPSVQVGRIQNFGSWSHQMVKPGFTCLGLEYFVNRGEGLWIRSDEELVLLAKTELDELGLCPASNVVEGYVVRVPLAYPIYDQNYARSLELIRNYLTRSWPELKPVGRNGMHRYNNQDHSMYTAMLTVDEILGGSIEDVWSVNVDEEYHEERSEKA